MARRVDWVKGRARRARKGGRCEAIAGGGRRVRCRRLRVATGEMVWASAASRIRRRAARWTGGRLEEDKEGNEEREESSNVLLSRSYLIKENVVSRDVITVAPPTADSKAGSGGGGGLPSLDPGSPAHGI